MNNYLTTEEKIFIDELLKKYPEYTLKSVSNKTIHLEHKTGKFILVTYEIDINGNVMLGDLQQSTEPFSLKCRPLK